MKARTPRCNVDYKFKLRMIVFVALLFSLLTIMPVIENTVRWLLQFMDITVVILLVVLLGCIVFISILTKLAPRWKSMKLWHLKMPEIFHHH